MCVNPAYYTVANTASLPIFSYMVLVHRRALLIMDLEASVIDAGETRQHGTWSSVNPLTAYFLRADFPSPHFEPTVILKVKQEVLLLICNYSGHFPAALSAGPSV